MCLQGTEYRDLKYFNLRLFQVAVPALITHDLQYL